MFGSSRQELSAFQIASLRDPAATGKLNHELILTLRTAYEAARRCYAGPDRSDLEFSFAVRSQRQSAEVLGSRFVGLKRGAPVEAVVIECVHRALNQPLTLLADSEQSFPDDLVAEIPIEIALGKGSSRSPDSSTPDPEK